MRPLTTTQAALLHGAVYGSKCRVLVDSTGADDWIDITTLQGFEWIDSVQMSDAVDSAVQTAKVVVNRAVAYMSMAPMVTSSIFNVGAPMLAPGRRIRIYTATIPAGATPSPSDWQLMFDGYIDEVEPAKQGVELTCRDLGALLQDTYIEYQTEYGSDAGTPVGDVMRAILYDHITVPLHIPMYLWEPTPATFLIAPYLQQKEPVMDALRKLADQMGWTCRYRYHDGGFDLALYAPPREGTVGAAVSTLKNSITEPYVNIYGFQIQDADWPSFPPQGRIQIYASPHVVSETFLYTSKEAPDMLVLPEDGNYITQEHYAGDVVRVSTIDDTAGGVVWTVGPSAYYDLTSAKLTRMNVRNRVAVVYDDEDSGVRTRLIQDDAVSQAKYGVRFMEVSEAATSQISTAEEALRMGAAALHDLSEPLLEQSAVLPYFFPVGLGDIMTWEANGKHYDTDQTLAVVGIEHSIKADSADTTLQCRGRPAGSYMRWLQMEGRPGVAPTAHLRDPVQPIIQVAGSPSSLVVTYDEPDPSNWSTTELYLKQDDGADIPQTQQLVTTAQPDGSTKQEYKWQRPPQQYLRASERSTRFVVAPLEPGTTYRVGLVVIDKAGNVGRMSAQVLQTAQRVGPYHSNRDTSGLQLVPNSDFNVYTLGADYPPDAWHLVPFITDPADAALFPPGALEGWHPNHIYRTQLDSKSGKFAIQVTLYDSQPVAIMETDRIPVLGGSLLQATVVAGQRPTADAPVGTYFPRRGIFMQIVIYCYDAAGNYLADPGNGTLHMSWPTAGTAMDTVMAAVQVPDNARFITMRVWPAQTLWSSETNQYSGSSFHPGTVVCVIDRVAILHTLARLTRKVMAYYEGFQSVGGSQWYTCRPSGDGVGTALTVGWTGYGPTYSPMVTASFDITCTVEVTGSNTLSTYSLRLVQNANPSAPDSSGTVVGTLAGGRCDGRTVVLNVKALYLTRNVDSISLQAQFTPTTNLTAQRIEISAVQTQLPEL